MTTAPLIDSAAPLLGQIPIPYVTSESAGWGRGLLDPSAVRLAPRAGFALALNDSRAVVRGGYGIFLNQWAYSVQTAFARNLPFFFTKQIDVPSDVRVPSMQTENILTSNSTGTVGGSIMDYAYSVEYSQTWSGGLQYELRPAVMAEVFYMGTWTLGADNATVRNVPEPGPGPIQARRPIPQLSRINAIRFDGKSIYHALTLRVERRLTNSVAYNVSYTLSQSKDDASSPGATESETNVPQNVRNVFDETGEWARSSFDHRHQFIASGVYQFPFFRDAGVSRGAARRLAGECDRHRPVGRAVHREPQCRSREHRRRPGAASRSTARPEPAGRRADAGALVRHVSVRAAGAVHLRQCAAQQRDRSRLRQRRLRARQDLGPVAAGSSNSGGRSSTSSTARTSICRTGPSAIRTSGASSAPRARARCSSASGCRSSLRSLLRRRLGEGGSRVRAPALSPSADPRPLLSV